VPVPLTNGFARTGYEQKAIEERWQKLQLERAAGAEHEMAGPQ
jgi:hypothetical protein